MALKLVLESLDGLSEDIAAEYVEKNGKFNLDTIAANGLAVEDVSGLKSALEKERETGRKTIAKLKAFEGIDDPKAAKEALVKVEEMANWDPDKEVAEKMKARESQLIAANKKETAKITARVDSAEGQLKKVLVENAAVTALTDAGGRVKVMLPHVMQQVRMRESDGQFIAEVIDDQGTPRVGDAQGNPMTIPQLVAEMKGNETFGVAFDGTGSTGTGAGGEQTRTGKPPQGGKKTVQADAGGIIVVSDPEAIAEGKTEVILSE